MKNRFSLLIAFCTLTQFTSASGQQFISEEFGSRQGLASAEIYTLFQDKAGFIWIGTKLGVSRFDGIGFVNFNGSSDMRFGKVFAIAQDSDQRMWIGAENGLFYFQSGEIHRVKLGNTFPDPWIYALYFSDKNECWIGTANGPVRLDHSGVQQILQGAELNYALYKNWSEISGPDNQVAHIYADKKNIYFGTRISVVQYDGNAFRLFWKSNASTLEDVSCMGIAADKSFYISCKNGKFYHLRQGSQSIESNFENSNGFAVAPDSSLYVLGGDHLYRYSGSTISVLYDFSNTGFDLLSSILIDKENNIWVGTWEGLIKLRKNIFDTYLPGVAPELNDIFSVESGDDQMLFGGNKGNIVYFDNGVFRKYLPGNMKPWPLSEVFGLYRDKSDYLWMGSGYQGMSVYHAGKLFHYEEPELFDQHAHGFYYDRDSNFYFLSEGGLTRVINPGQTANLKFEYFPWKISVAGQYLKMFDQVVLKNNDTYFATNFGLVYFNGDTLVSVQSSNDTLNEAIITAVELDDQENVWLSTGNDGVYAVRVTGNQADIKSHFNRQSGLLADATLDLLITGENIWLAHYSGLTWLVRRGDKYAVAKRINERDGFLPYDFTYIKLAEDKTTGNIWVATTNGVQTFSPREMSINTYDAYPEINDVLLFNGAVPLQQYSDHRDALSGLATHPVLPYNKNSISFLFQAISLTQPSQNSCRYKLIGYNSNWTYAQGKDEVTFAALAPGDYQFILEAANNDGIWSRSANTYFFTIEKPFWATWWFIVSAIGITALISFTIYRYRLNQLIKIAAIRNKIAGDLHDDVGSTLSSIRMYSDIVASKLEDTHTESSTLLKKMSENSAEMIENMSDIVWAIKPSNDAFQNLETRIFNFATELCNAKNIQLHMHIDPAIAQLKMTMEQRRDLYLICKEAVNNAVKYSGGRDLFIRFEKQQGNHLMLISDNGTGFETKPLKRGNGLENMAKRALSHQWKFEVHSEPGNGTQIKLMGF